MIGRSWWFGVAAALMGGSALGAAPPSMEVDVGFGGVVLADRLTPITVWVTPSDGAEPINGLIEVRYTQDAVQGLPISLLAPVAALPGQRSRVQVFGAIPMACDGMEVSLLSPGGRVLASQTLSSSASIGDEDELPMPAILGSGSVVVLTLAPSDGGSLRSSVRFLEGRSADEVQVAEGEAPEQAPAWPGMPKVPTSLEVRVAEVPVERWPAEPIGYLGATCVVVDGSTLRALEPSVRAAIGRWVAGGGRLVVQANSAGLEWREWLTQIEPGAELIEIGPTAEAAMPADLRGLGARSVANAADPAHWEAADTVNGRLIRLSEKARSRGWVSRWGANEAANDAGLMAEGPMGLGWVTVLGIEPERVPKALSKAGTSAVWRDALGTSLAQSRIDLEASRIKMQQQPWMYQGSGSPEPGLSEVLQPVNRIVPPGTRMFVGIVGLMGLLALLVGPVDLLRMRAARRRERPMVPTWLTALGWIAGASAIAWVGPTALRSGPSTRMEVASIDIGPGSIDTGEAPVARAAVVGLFWNQQGTTTPEAGRSGGDEAGGWWRVASVSTPMAQMGRSGVASRLVTPAVSVQVPAGAEGVGGEGRLQPVSMRMWSLRAFMETARPRGSTPRARVLREEGKGSVKVEIEGLEGQGTSVLAAAILHRGRWRMLGVNDRGEGRWTATLDAAALSPAGGRAASRGDAFGDPEVRAAVHPTALADARLREEALWAYGRSDAHAVLWMRVDDEPSAAANGGDVNHTRTVYRIVLDWPAEADVGEAR